MSLIWIIISFIIYYSILNWVILKNKWLCEKLLKTQDEWDRVSWYLSEHISRWRSNIIFISVIIISLIIGFFLTLGISDITYYYSKDNFGVVTIDIKENRRLVGVEDGIFGFPYPTTVIMEDGYKPKEYLYSKPGSKRIFKLVESKNIPDVINDK